MDDGNRDNNPSREFLLETGSNDSESQELSSCCDDREDEQLSLRTTIRLRINASNLPTRGVRRIKDPDTFALVVTKNASFETEIVQQDRHPQYARHILVDYEYGSESSLWISIFEAGTKKSYGMVHMELSDLLGTRHRSKVKRLGRTVGGGCVYCQAEIVSDSEIIRFQASATIDTKKNIDPYFEIAQKTEHHFLVVYRSIVLKGTTEPSWDVAEMDLGTLCGADLHRSLRITVKSRPNRVLGYTETSIQHMIDHGTLELELFNRKQEKVGNLVFHGTKIVATEEANNEPLSDLSSLSPVAAPTAQRLEKLLKEGLQTDLCVAIDFTSSNQDPRMETSLHFMSGDSLNDYEEALTSIYSCLTAYNVNESVVWGFGAKFGGVLRHLFQCGSSPTVQGLDGVLKAYRCAFQQGLVMSEPTVITQVLQAAAMRAKRSMDNKEMKYTVLLVLTDGIVEDCAETKRKLNVYDHLPLSVVIIGVGRANFSALHHLAESPSTTVCEYRVHQHDPSAISLAALGDLPSHICRHFK